MPINAYDQDILLTLCFLIMWEELRYRGDDLWEEWKMGNGWYNDNIKLNNA